MVADLLVPVQTNNPISRHTRSATLTRKRGCSTLGLLPPGPHPFRWFGLRSYPFGYFQSCNHPPRRDFISAHQAGITYLEIYPTVTDLCIQPVSEWGTAGTPILPATNVLQSYCYICIRFCFLSILRPYCRLSKQFLYIHFHTLHIGLFVSDQNLLQLGIL